MISVPVYDPPQITDDQWDRLTDLPPWDPTEENQVTMDQLLSQEIEQ